jgi:hypothetical protein
MSRLHFTLSIVLLGGGLARPDMATYPGDHCDVDEICVRSWPGGKCHCIHKRAGESTMTAIMGNRGQALG